MRNRWIIAGLLAAAGILAGPASDRARAQPTGWDVSGNEGPPLWAPVGTYQHDGSGVYAGIEGVLLSMKREVGLQQIAFRGVMLNSGSANIVLPNIQQGNFVGSREPALDTDNLGRTTWGAGLRFTLGYRMDNGWNFSVSWLHLFDVKYSGGAGMLGPNFFEPGPLMENTFLTAPVYNFSPDFVGRNPFPNPPWAANPTIGIWNAASDMTILFTQRFDNWDFAGKFPVFETENARSYAIAGARYSWIWERFQWRTVKPEVVDNGAGEFVFATSADSAARYINTLSQRMYGPMVGVGHEVMLYAGQAGAFGFGCEVTGAALLNIGKERAKYIREDETTQVKRVWNEQVIVPNVNAAFNLNWQPMDGVSFRFGYNFLMYFNTKYMEEPVSFNAGALDPAYGVKLFRLIHGTNFGVSFTF
jgi:hypothetical protein